MGMNLRRHKPNIENLYKVLRREAPPQPVLFELFLNGPLYERLAGRKAPSEDKLEALRFLVDAFAAAGYDYATTHASELDFPSGERGAGGKTISLNRGFVIHDEASFEQYAWPDPGAFDDSALDTILPCLPDGMRLMVLGPNGVLENVIKLCGYENLCYMLYENRPLAEAVFGSVGERLEQYYLSAAQHESVGVIMLNDDWGFNTQTFLSPDDMRSLVFPWHKRYIDIAHRYGKPAVLHSCGNLSEVMDDIIGMGYDGKHSFEDAIMPVEQAYDRWGGRIAILGGIDVDFMIRSTPDEIAARCRAMLLKTAASGGYALGTGNSVPEYIPEAHYLAMIRVALDA